MVEIAVIVLIAIFAVLAIQSRFLRRSIVYLAVFSLLGAFLYLLYAAAPELAIAEAVIGSGLVTLLYLAALKRTRVYTVAVVSEAHRDHITDSCIERVERSKALSEIRRSFRRREFELHAVYVSVPLEEAPADYSGEGGALRRAGEGGGLPAGAPDAGLRAGDRCGSLLHDAGLRDVRRGLPPRH